MSAHNKAHRHSKRASNLGTNRAFKRNALMIAALARPCRDHRRAPKRLAHAQYLAANDAKAAAESAQAAAGEQS